MTRPTLSLFIPVYNEEDILEKNIKEVVAALEKIGLEYEVFVVDDSSTDNTPKLAESLAANYERLKFIRYENGPSRRENLAKSFWLAKGEIIAFMDADLATDLEALPKLIGAVEGGADIATGNRYHKDSAIRRTAYRFTVSRMANALLSALFGSKLRDHFCGFKAFRARSLFLLIVQLGYDHKFMRGVLWDAELLLLAQRWGYRIATVPIKWIEAPKSAMRVRREIRLVPYLFKLWLKSKRL